ncbi:Auxin-responsive protein [Psidium guajava]|nr:Auxin-responsive protein [Psidium guajava]
MGSEKIRVRDEAAGSVLISERVLSRNSSAGYSSRVCYGRTPEGVPFEWEMQPGTPKNPPKEQDLPPLSPPPAVVSQGLPRPCIICEDPPKESTTWSKLMFWKKVKIHKRSHNKSKGQKGRCDGGKAGVDDPRRGHSKVESLEFWSSDVDLAASPHCSSASSLSTTLSFRKGANLAESLDHRPRSCAPWNLTALAVYFAKRI